MKTTNRETIKLTVNILIRKFCEDKAAKNFSMSKKEAEDYGACEGLLCAKKIETNSLKILHWIVLPVRAFPITENGYERKIQCIRSLRCRLLH